MQIKTRKLRKQIEIVDDKIGRAKTTGKASGVVVQVNSGKANVDIDPELLSKKKKDQLEKALAQAINQTLDKQRNRAIKEVKKLTDAEAS